MSDEFREEMRQLRAAELTEVGGAAPCPTITVVSDNTMDEESGDCC
jgi:hypothetical protein